MRIKYLIEKELKQFVRNPFLPRMALVFPIIIILILPMVVTMDVTDVKVCVLDKDATTASARLMGKITGSPYFVFAGKVTDYDQGLSKIEYGDADIVITIPDGFEKALLGGTAVDLLISANATNSTKGGLGGNYLSAIIMDYVSNYVEELHGSQISPIKVSGIAPVIAQLNMYNPSMNYRTFMLPALMGMIVIIISAVFPALAIVGEKESGTIEQINVTPVKKWEFILAKLIPYWALGIAVISLAFLFAWLVYGFVPVGGYGVIYCASILMTAAMSGIGLLISNFSDTFQQAIYMFFFFMMTNLLMSGLFTPVKSMPNWAQTISCVMPPRFFLEVLRSAFLKGSRFVHLWPQLLILSGFAACFNTLAIITYKKRG